MKNNHSRAKEAFNMYSGLPKEVYILFIGKMVNCIGAFINPLMVLILTRKIGLSVREAGMLVTASTILQAPCVIFGGKIVDKIGRKKVMTILPAISAIIYIICGFINPSRMLAVFIIIASCFASVAYPSYDSMVADVTTNENRKASFSLIYMGLNLGYSIGPIIGGILFENHLSWVFAGDGITTLISVLLIGIFIKETKDTEEYNKGQKESILEKEEEGSIFEVLFKRPILIYYLIIDISFNFAYSQLGFSIPIKLSQLFGDMGAKYYGILGGCNGLIVILFTPIMTMITKKWKIIKIIALGGLLYSLSFFGCGFAATKLSFYLIIIGISIGEIAICTNSGTFVSNYTPASHRGRVNSMLPLIFGVGSALGSSFMGIMIEDIGINNAFIIVGIIALIGAVFMYSLNYVNVKV